MFLQNANTHNQVTTLCSCQVSSQRCCYASIPEMSSMSLFILILWQLTKAFARFFGIVQAGYRAVLDAMTDPVSPILPAPELMNTLTPTEAPSTPRAQSHNASLTLSEGSTTNITTPLSFSINSFTTVPPTFVPNTPMQKNRTKRERGDDGANKDGSPVKKRRG